MIAFEQLIVLFMLGAVPALFSYMLDYGLGHPGDDRVNNKALLFRWTFWLSERRLKQSPQYTVFYNSFADGMKDTDPMVKMANRDVFEQSVVDNGRRLFTWESFAGMCVYCTNIYIAAIIGLGSMGFACSTGNNIFVPIVIIITSHGILRKLKAK